MVPISNKERMAPVVVCHKCHIPPVVTDKEAYCPVCGLKVTPGNPVQLPPKVLWNRCNASSHLSSKDRICIPRRKKPDGEGNAYSFREEW